MLGRSIKGIADDLQNRITTMSRASAIRTARTAITGAQNAGRMDCYAEAKKIGIKLKKQWEATLDNRTRHSHAMLDGVQVENEEKFPNGCRFPGDQQGAPAEIYNCRCTLISKLDGVNTSNAQRRAQNPVTGEWELIPDMTYKEWAAWKESENKTAWDLYMKKGRNLSADRKQWQEYRSVLGKEVPVTLDKFQSMKYTEPEKWKNLQGYKRYKGRVPEATAADYSAYKAVKATGVIGSVRVPPEKIAVSSLVFNDEHASRHGCTLDDAKGYIQTAKCSIRRNRWDGESINYYSLDGASYIDAETMKIKTAFSEKDFDPTTRNVVEVFKK